MYGEVNNINSDVCVQASGGGASTGTNTISVDKSIHIHIHSNDEKLISKVIRSLNGIIGKRSIAIENASGLSEEDIQGSIVREFENRQMCTGVK